MDEFWSNSIRYWMNFEAIQYGIGWILKQFNTILDEFWSNSIRVKLVRLLSPIFKQLLGIQSPTTFALFAIENESCRIESMDLHVDELKEKHQNWIHRSLHVNEAEEKKSEFNPWMFTRGWSNRKKSPALQWYSTCETNAF